MSRAASGRSWKPPSTLPPLYAGWVADLLDGPLPHEGEATCEDCAMWPSAGVPVSAGITFNRETKCCTYIPALPTSSSVASWRTTIRRSRQGARLSRRGSTRGSA